MSKSNYCRAVPISILLIDSAKFPNGFLLDARATHLQVLLNREVSERLAVLALCGTLVTVLPQWLDLNQVVLQQFIRHLVVDLLVEDLIANLPLLDQAILVRNLDVAANLHNGQHLRTNQFDRMEQVAKNRLSSCRYTFQLLLDHTREVICDARAQFKALRVMQFLERFWQVRNSNQAQKTDLINIRAGIDTNKNVGAQSRNSVHNLEIEPTKIGRFQ